MNGVARAAAVAVLTLMTNPLRAADTQLVLPLTVNEVGQGEVSVIISETDVFLPITAFERAGLTGVQWKRVQTVARLRRASRVIDEGDAVSLRALAPWVSYNFDEANLTLSVTTEPRFLGATSLTLQTARPENVVYSRDPSSFFNYAVSSVGLSDVSAFGELGSSLRGNLLYSTFSTTPDTGFVRGLTNYTIDERDSLRRWTVGDGTVLSGDLGGSGFVGGFTVSRSFDLDPYFIRFPSLTLGGAALTPSTVDIYVNGILVDRRQLPPGPFEIRNIPGSAGSSNAQVVVRDAFGREQSSSARFYYSTTILARGLSEYLLSAGFIRDNFATESFDYGDPLLVGFHRRGITDWLTLGGRFEASEDLISGGPSIALATRAGEIELKAAASESAGRQGAAGQMTFRRLSRRTSFGGSVRQLSREYANFSLPATTDRTITDATVFASYLPSWGNVGLQWSSSRMRDAEDRQRIALLTNVSLTATTSLLFSVGASEQGGRRSGEYFAGFSFQTARNTTANIAYDHRDGRDSILAEMQRPLPLGTGYGYRFQTISGRSRTDGSASVQYQNRVGRYEVTFDPFNLRDPILNVAGGVVYQGGAVIPARPVDQSFALVRVRGVEGVRVYSSNQLIGRTDERGNLLVPNLLPYYGNRLRIDDRDVPLRYDVQAVEATVAPPFRGGALVDFMVREVRTVTGTMIVSAGGNEVVPVYGQITLAAGGATFVSPLGGGGEFYFENISTGAY
ncbi:MAG TPA: fimbria/pilus outer membrane usher protein, partial [Thermoanaerobaculia bacterium]|nr:fimbria/pilus outer membrane usher protein [Thermoanaerobaculia bacterium]